MNLRSTAIGLGISVFAVWAVRDVGIWTLLITVPLSLYVAHVATAMEIREGRRS